MVTTSEEIIYRPTKKRLINIDTRFASTFNKTTCEFTFNFPEKINRVRSIKIISAEIPKTFTNFSSAQNSSSIYVSADPNFASENTDTILIDNAQYDDEANLILAINAAIAQLQSGRPSRNLTFALLDSRCTISSSSTEKIYVKFILNKNRLASLQQSLGWKLGFRTAVYALVPAEIWNADSSIDLLGPRYGFLLFDSLNTASTIGIQVQFLLSIAGKQVVARIPLTNTTYKNIISVNEIQGLISQKIETAGPDCIGGLPLQRIRVLLTDEFGNPLLDSDFSFILSVETQ